MGAVVPRMLAWRLVFARAAGLGRGATPPPALTARTGEVRAWPNVRCSRHSASHAVEPAAGLCAGRCAEQVVVRS